MIRLLHKSSSKKTLPDKKNLKILAVQIAGIGDLVLATPAFDAIKEKYPDCQLDLITTPRSTTLLEKHPSITNIYPFDISAYRIPKNLIKLGVFFSLLKELKPLKANKYDVILSLNNISSQRGGLTLGLLFLAIGARIWVGRNTDNRGNYFDYALEDNSKMAVPEAITKLKTAGLLGSLANPRPLSIHISNSEKQQAEELLPGDKKRVALLPGVNDPTRAWPVDNFAKVGKELASQGFEIIVIGGPAESEMGDIICRYIRHENAINLAGKCKLRESLALFEKVNLVVANNTGPMHMAAAVGAPIVAIFDPLHQNRYRPWTPDGWSNIVYHSDPEIKDFDILFNDLPKYIQQVTAPEVMDSCREMLKFIEKNKQKEKEYTTPDGVFKEDRESGIYRLIS